MNITKRMRKKNENSPHQSFWNLEAVYVQYTCTRGVRKAMNITNIFDIYKHEVCPEGIQPGSKKNKAFIEEDRRCNKQYT